LVLLAWSTAGLAKPEAEACLELGALAWDDWTTVDGGGSGLPAGETARDYVRCKSCHGWDRLGENGGYVRRTRTAERPNAGLGDIDTRTRDIAPGLGQYYEVNAAEVLHEGIGRSFEEGSGSWVPLPSDPTPAQIAAYSAGYTLGNQHPDFSATGANAGDTVLTQDQLDCLVDFINYADADPKFYFEDIDTDRNPVAYTIHSGASATAGQTFYQQHCFNCHGDPATNYVGSNDGHPAGGIVAYLAADGKYSEFVHKARWGIPDTVMTRAMIGSPNSQNMIDLMLYLQQLTQAPFAITSGISGTWWNEDRDGEGFVIDVADGGVFVATFYTYDSQGNQFWLIGNDFVSGDSVELELYATDGAVYGPDFDPTMVSRYPWGTASFTFGSCWSAIVDLVPNQNYAGGFEAMSIALTRLTTPANCP
jgi:hypothetical protein